MVQSAIDNATRNLIASGQLPVTCGLYFSLGHSTIVIVAIIAIAVSTSVYNHFTQVGEVGSIIGPAISGSFLFIVGLANSVILFRAIREERTRRRGDHEITESSSHRPNTLLMRIIGPVITFVDRPYKMYPVGFLFGLGFDTASSISLLAIAAMAQSTEPSQGKVRRPADVVILPLLFTAGMTLVDSLDSILMLYSYSDFPKLGWGKHPRGYHFFLQEGEREVFAEASSSVVSQEQTNLPPAATQTSSESAQKGELAGIESAPNTRASETGANLTSPDIDHVQSAKMNVMSNLSIVLTLMSILVAFSISLIMIMSLIGEQCSRCREFAKNDPGLAGRWWRAWAAAGDKSEYVGIGIVGAFVLVVGSWYGTRWILKRRKGSQPRLRVF
ncbi:NicO-domain-containing protein, partial [Flagelloscypha sp. PMI_526]